MPLSVNMIKELLDPKVYLRALDYFYNDHVRSLVTDDYPAVTAMVKGSNRSLYRINMNLESNKYACSCPYPRICKHIGAVLLELVDIQDRNPSMLNQKQETAILRNIINERKKALSEISDKTVSIKPSQSTADDNFLPEAALQSANAENPAGKFIFVLLVRYDKYADCYYLRRGLRYIKKDGSPGRIEEYNSRKEIEPMPEECSLFNTMLLHKNEINLSDAADYIFDTEGLPLFFNQNKSYYQLVKNKISKITIRFKVSYVEFEKGSSNIDAEECVIFKPYLYINKQIKPDEGIPIERFFSSARNFGAVSDDNTLHIGTDAPLTSYIVQVLKAKRELDINDINKLQAYVKKNPSANTAVIFDHKKVNFRFCVPDPVLYMEGYPLYCSFTLNFRYATREINAGDPSSLLEAIEDNSKGYILYVRDSNIEETYINLLMAIVTDCYVEQDRFFAGTIKPDKFIINFTNANAFLIKYGARLAAEGYEIRFKQKKIRPMSAGGKVQKRVTSGIDWFEISLSYRDYEGNEHSLKIEEDLLNSGLIRHKDEYIPLSAEDIDQLKTISKNTTCKNGKYKVPKYNFASVENLKETVPDTEKKIFEETMALYERLKNFKSIKKYALPKNFRAKLRDYQKEGYRWLMFLKEYKVNGCLADDMGLGKTIQTLALFQKLKEEGNFKTSILVVPVSTITNWKSETERFCSNLNVSIHLGQNRIREASYILSHDLIITSYQTLARDIKFFKDINFYYIVIDEAQAIKNSRSQSFETVTSVNAKHRISLTGTPVENSCSDLYSQMEFLHPGLLGTQHSFRKNYLYPIEKNNDKDAAEDLRKTVFPFIMRRKKEDVATDLPDKEEITYYVEMHPKQHKLYETYRKKIKGDLDKEIEKKGLPGAAMAILEAMLRLRQMALFPQLVNQYFDPVESAKFEVLKDLMEEITSENHKVLVFSQFVESLKIIRGYCDSKEWNYSYIDGSTKKRETQIKNFQSDDKIRIFLLSIKAGGVGINLTAADYVIIFDPWWNPAVESQAIDRSHRIGQTNKVIAYKLIVKNTIEEKMLELQKRKKDLVTNLITEEKSFFKSLTKNDIDYILS